MIRVIVTYRANRARSLMAETARQARLTWASNALIRQGMDHRTIAGDLNVLTRLGVTQADAERTIHAALAAAAAAYRVTLAVDGADAASDSENTDTGRIASVSR